MESKGKSKIYELWIWTTGRIGALPFRGKGQTDRINTIPQAGGERSVWKNMPQMRPTARATHFRAPVAQEIIGMLLHGLPANRFKITGPPTPGMKLGIRPE